MGKRFALVHGAWHDRSTWLRRVLAVCVAATALSLALGWSATGAEAADVSCGDTITADTTLHKDLVNCPGNGIVIGADDITLDLNGHTIDGDGTGSGVSWEFATHDGITVKHGSIRQFETGLHAVGSRHIRLLGLAASRNHSFGIALAAVARVLVRNCSANHTTARERHREGTGLLVTTASGPGLPGRGGPSHHVRIVNSSFRHNVGDGIRSMFTTDNVIEGNLLSGNGGTGIAWRGSRNRLSRNRIVGGETGITVHGSQNVIAHNRVSDSRHDGVGILAGHGNLLADNVIAGAATGIRLSGELELLGRGGAINTVIRGNRLRRASEDGLLVASTAKHTLLRHNSARHSQDDGFDVNDPTTKLTKNRAIRNRDLGIEAVRGVIDGGGNVARHNRDRRQCTHISCS